MEEKKKDYVIGYPKFDMTNFWGFRLKKGQTCYFFKLEVINKNEKTGLTVYSAEMSGEYVELNDSEFEIKLEQ